MKNKIINLLFLYFTATASIVQANDTLLNYSASYQLFFVGELGEKWEFPSDHLPRGATVGNFHIAFWNILNKNYLYHIEENSQGLRESSILRDNIPYTRYDSLTVRELLTCQIILGMIYHPAYPRSLIALQETHEDVYRFLFQHLPQGWEIATPPGQHDSQDIFLYDSRIFELVSLEAVLYSPQFSKTIFTITLQEKTSGKIFRFLQSHIPGGPNSEEGCKRFSEEALRQFDPALPLILMGDMNQSPDVIERALVTAFKEKGWIQPFSYLPIAHPSHLNTKREASWFDNFFYYSPDIVVSGSDLPEEFDEPLIPIIKLLDELQP